MRFQYNIPDLSDLQSISVLFMLDHFFRGWGPKNHVAFALVMNYIRIVDLSVQEYQNGRNAIFQFSNEEVEFNFGAVLSSSGHFEVCINSIKRAISFLKAIKAIQDVPTKMKNIIPRNLVVLMGGIEKQITNMRHAIQHLEKDIISGKIQKGQAHAHALYVNTDNIELGVHKISFLTLSKGWRSIITT